MIFPISPSGSAPLLGEISTSEWTWWERRNTNHRLNPAFAAVPLTPLAEVRRVSLSMELPITVQLALSPPTLLEPGAPSFPFSSSQAVFNAVNGHLPPTQPIAWPNWISSPTIGLPNSLPTWQLEEDQVWISSFDEKSEIPITAAPLLPVEIPNPVQSRPWIAETLEALEQLNRPTLANELTN